MTQASGKPLEALSDREVRQRLRHAEKTVTDIAAIPASEVVRIGKAEESLKAMHAAVDIIEETAAELSRRAEVAKKAELKDAVESIPLARERRRREAPTPQHPAHGVALRYLRRTMPPEIQGVNLDVSRNGRRHPK